LDAAAGREEEMRLVECWHAAASVCGAPEGEYSKPPSYLEYYEQELAAYRGRRATIVEVGVFRGQFLETLAAFLPDARIVGIDSWVDRVRVTAPHVEVVKGDQSDTAGLASIFSRVAPDGIDILFDDASHVAALSKSLFDVAYPRIRSGGAYYIEDWGTGYVSDWPDGHSSVPAAMTDIGPKGFPTRIRSHDYGMVGLVKSMIDEVGSRPDLRTREVSIRPGICKLVKA
jgi:hypothetical protein